MPAPMFWFRAMCDWTRDPVIRALSPDDFRLYFALHAIAAKAEPRGHILLSNGRAPSHAQIADEVGPGVTPDDVADALDRLDADGLLARAEGGEWRIARWDTEQVKPSSSTARVQRMRARRAQESAAAQGQLPTDPDGGGGNRAHGDTDVRVEQVSRVLAERAADAKEARGETIDVRDRYIAKVAADKAEAVRRIVFFYPDVTDPDALADLFERDTSGVPRLTLVPAPAVDPEDLAEPAGPVPDPQSASDAITAARAASAGGRARIARELRNA